MEVLTNNKWFNAEQARQYLGFKSKGKLYELTSRREIKFYKPGGKYIFFRVEDLEDYMMSGAKEIIIHTR